MVRGAPRCGARLVVGLGVFIACAVGGAAPAAAAGTAVFGDEQPLLIDLGESHSSEVLIVNSAPSDAVRVTLQVTGPAAQYVDVPEAMEMPPGGTPVTVTVHDDAVPSEGTLVLIGADGSLDRKAVQLVGTPLDDAAPAREALVTGTFDKLSVSATSFVPSFFRPLPSAVAWWPVAILVGGVTVVLVVVYTRIRQENGLGATAASIGAVVGAVATVVLLGGAIAATIDGFRDAPVESQTWSVFPPAASSVEADLAGNNGLSGVLAVDRDELAVSDLPGAGSYAGTVDTLPEQAAGDVTVIVDVRDWWVYAAIAVGLGVLVGTMLGAFYLRRPAAEFDVAVADLRRRIAYQESEWQRVTVGRPWGEPYRGVPFLLDRVDAVKKPGLSGVADATAKLDAVEALLENLDSLRDQVQTLFDDRDRLVRSFSSIAKPPDTQGWLAPLAMSSPLVGTTDQATAAVKDRTTAAANARVTADVVVPVAEELRGLFGRLGGIASDAERWRLDELVASHVVLLLEAADKAAVTAVSDALPDIRNAIDAAEEQVPTDEGPEVAADQFGGVPAGPGGGGLPGRVPLLSVERDDLQTVSVTVEGLRKDTLVRWRFSDGTPDSPEFRSPAPVGGDATVTIQHLFVGDSEAVSAELLDASGKALDRWTGRVTRKGRHERSRTRFTADNTAVAIVAALVAVGSGMGALYLTDTTWGSSGDYVAALLWGAVTAEAVKAVIALVGSRQLTQP
jgi:hypothetical protein